MGVAGARSTGMAWLCKVFAKSDVYLNAIQEMFPSWKWNPDGSPFGSCFTYALNLET